MSQHHDWQEKMTAQRAAYFVDTADLPASQRTVLPLFEIGNTDQAHQELTAFVRSAATAQDCNDFRFNRILRCRFRHGASFPQALDALVRDTLLAAPWYGLFTEEYPGFRNSENHHLTWATAEYLTAQSWPDASFGDGRTAIAHLDRARFLIANWIDKRLRFGYGEWNSASYMPVNINALLNLIDFAGEDDVRSIASTALTFMLADVAADSIGGLALATQARLYPDNLFAPRAGSIPAVFAFLLGIGRGSDSLSSSWYPSADFAATTTYQAPAWLREVALCSTPVWSNRERHRSCRDFFYKLHSSFWRPPFELTDEASMQRFQPDAIHHTGVHTERRTQTLISAAIIPESLHAQGNDLHQCLAWVIALASGIPLFANRPPLQTSERAKQQFWAGGAELPRCALVDGLCVALYTGSDSNKAEPFTHGYFPTDQFDEWRRTPSGWFVARKGESCAAINSTSDLTLTEDGEWKGRELRAGTGPAGWLGLVGIDGEDVEALCERCEAISIDWDQEAKAIDVRAGNTWITIAPGTGARVNGKQISIDNWPQMANPIVTSPYGEPVIEVTTGDKAETIDGSLAYRIKRRWERLD